MTTPRRQFLAATVAALGPMLAQAQTASTGLTVAPPSQAGVMPRLTFPGIDTYRGVTAAGLLDVLSRLDGERWTTIGEFASVTGGRVADPLLVGDAYRTGRYEVLMHIADYFERLGVAVPTPAFLSVIALRFAIHAARERVHLPVLFSPWSYSYYRGSFALDDIAPHFHVPMLCTPRSCATYRGS